MVRALPDSESLLKIFFACGVSRFNTTRPARQFKSRKKFVEKFFYRFYVEGEVIRMKRLCVPSPNNTLF